METANKPMISLEEARQLVELLENEKYSEASALIDSTLMQNSAELFAEVGKLTRQLHDSLNSFQLDPRISDLANEDIPDAQMRLGYVLETTENAANQTMDAIETTMPLAEAMLDNVAQLQTQWSRLMVRDMPVDDFKSMCHDVDKFLVGSSQDLSTMSKMLTDVLVAQGFQDLTGQVIRRVIELVTEVQDSLVGMLTAFGNMSGQPGGIEDSVVVAKHQETAESTPEGPIVDAENRNDVVKSQDDVDDLLSSLGF